MPLAWIALPKYAFDHDVAFTFNDGAPFLNETAVNFAGSTWSIFIFYAHDDENENLETGTHRC
ncbi:MAG: hypothetical protein GY869_09115 [Planctomycetes bacterium]|nr:hypothetical protein [Planctomycetota bacterium]